MVQKRILLASASPRRRELLRLITPDFDCAAADVDETLPQGSSPRDAVLYLSKVAFEILRSLSGREHSVFTGVTLLFGGKARSFCEETKVRFYDLSDAEITEYISTGECLDKAGAYGIQGKGSLLVERIDGDYFNVVGLPVAQLYRELKLIEE